MLTNSCVNSMPLPYKLVGNVLLVAKPIVKELALQNNNQLPQNICLQVNGKTVWATYSTICNLTKQAVYKSPDNFVVLDLPVMDGKLAVKESN